MCRFNPREIRPKLVFVNQRLKLEMTEEKDNQTAQVRPIETKLKKTVGGLLESGISVDLERKIASFQ